MSKVGGRGDDLISPAIQLAAIRDHCQRRGYELVQVLEDVDRSGRLWKRRQIEQAVADIEAGNADAIIVWKGSRVTRNRLDWAIAVDRVEGVGGLLESATEPVDTTTSTGRFTRGMLAELAAFESDRIGEAWKETHRARFEAGLPVTGVGVPWAFTSAGRAVNLDPVRADAVRELYRQYLAGTGFHGLAQWLQANGHPTRTGVRWHETVVKQMMDSPMNAGLVTYKGETRQGAFEAIIDQRTWEAYQAQRRDRRRAGRRQGSPFLLTGLAKCGVCGRAMVGSTGTGLNKPRYSCMYASKQRAHKAFSVLASALDAAVLEWLAGRTAELNTLVDQAPATNTAVTDTLLIESQITTIDRQLARLTKAFVADVVPEAAYTATRDELQGERAQLVAGLTAAQDASTMRASAPAASDLLAEWDSLPTPARKAALRAMIRQVTVLQPRPEVIIRVDEN